MEELKVGNIIKERYELVRFLGSGSFGEVWLAQDLLTGRNVALKIYLSLDPAGVDEFKQEYTNTIDLSDQHLLTPDYFDVYNRRPFLVMKYCENGSSSKLIGNISEDQLWQFVEDVASGLNVLHNQSEPIVHQDIKPDNILVDRSGRFLITDFGISKRLRATMRRHSKRDVSSGAMPYMAPERFDSSPRITPASDIWSLGASIYELATGELPFSGFGGAMQRNGADMPSLNENFSQALNDVMQRCLKVNATERPRAIELAGWAKDRRVPLNLSSTHNRMTQQHETVSETITPTSVVKPSTSSPWIYIVTAITLIAGAFFFWRDIHTSEGANKSTNVLKGDTIVDEEVLKFSSLSVKQQILNTTSAKINGQTVHFYEGHARFVNDSYPVMIGFITSDGRIINAIYKNINSGGCISLNCHSIDDESIRLSGKDGNNDFTLTLSKFPPYFLTGTVNDEKNFERRVELQPTTKSFEFTKKADVKFYTFKVGAGDISIPSFLTKDGETNGGGSIFVDSSNQIELKVQKWWNTDLSDYVGLQHGINGCGTTLLSRKNCVVESGTKDNKIYYWKAYLDTNTSIPVLYTAEVTYPISRRDEMDGLLAKIFNPFPNIK